ncbi:MAG: hypothetical protein HUJ26_09500 [Planctomycetaceae bacterium]|nr:hypothetical protein [Planctomycetaceae bacterium]
MIRVSCATLMLSYLCLIPCQGNAQEATAPVDTVEKNDKITLRYQFQTGDEWHYQLRQKEVQTARSEAGEQTALNDSSQWKHYQIIETYQDGSALLEVIVDRIQIQFTSIVDDQQQVISYDSKHNRKPPVLLKGIEKSLGTFAKVKMSPSGELLDVDLGRKLEEEELKKAGKIQGLPIKLPADPIAVGDSWVHKIPVKLSVSRQLNLNREVFADFKMQTNYQLKKVEADRATISFSTIVQPRITDPFLRARMMQYLPSGTIMFDLKQGKIISRTEDIDETVLNAGGPKTAMELRSRKLEKMVPAESELSPSAN